MSESQEKKKAVRKKPESGNPKSGKVKRETPEQVIDKLLEGYFSEAEIISQEPKDFSPNGIRGMLAVQAGLFLSRQMREPDVEPPWFGVKLLDWAFPTETIKSTRELSSFSGGDGVINLINHVPRPDMEGK